MDSEEMRRLLGGAASTTGQGGPAGGQGADEEGALTAVLQALSVLSTDLGAVQTRMRALDADVRQATGLQAQLAKLEETVTDLHQAVQELSGKTEPPPPPPQPWDWAGMDWESELTAVATLALWVDTRLSRWWPRATAEALPGCWMKHPEMLRALSLLFVSYQQAYEHPQRRVHHEVDFRRTLDDTLGDITTAVRKYHCADATKHITSTRTRLDRALAKQHVRGVAAAAAFDADQAGDTDRVSQIMETYGVRVEDMRAQAITAWPELATVASDVTARAADRQRAAQAAAHLLDAYQVIDTTDLRHGPDLEAVLVLLHEVGDPRFAVLRGRYGPLAQKYATIYQNLSSLRPLTDRGRALMDRHHITEQDIEVVYSMTIG
ncbi:hypothetical protein [Nocardiopsis sp. NPDC006938]|uniref:hypothetical protein n=1 Tax=Nocardiopsis sp. NPDC006938 TaxID=3364337 RepID=UPI0036B2D607